MPVIDVGQPSWQYDTVAKTLLATFTEPCPRSETDPAGWKPSWSYRLTLPTTGAIAKVPFVDPNAPPPADPPPVEPPPVP